MKKQLIFCALGCMAMLTAGVGAITGHVPPLANAISATLPAQTAFMAKTDFESMPIGNVPFIQLAVPPGISSAALIGNLTIMQRQPTWPGGAGNAFGDRALHIEGEADIVIVGDADVFGFSAGIRNNDMPNPTFSLDVINTANQAQRAAALTFMLNGQQLPTFGNFAIEIVQGRYGFGKIRGDVIGEIVIGNHP